MTQQIIHNDSAELVSGLAIIRITHIESAKSVSRSERARMNQNNESE